MPGPWSASKPPVRPGSYTNWRALAQPTIPSNGATTVCVPFTHDWGPLQTLIAMPSWQTFLDIFGTDDTAGSRAIKQCFFGEGLPGYGGAGTIIGYRMQGSSANTAKTAKLELKNSTPAVAAEVKAKFPGTYGEKIKIAIVAKAGEESTKKELQVILGTTIIESFTFNKTGAKLVEELEKLVALGSGYITLTKLIDAVELTNITATALTGGADGATLIAADWTAMLAAVQPEPFAIFAPFELTNETVMTAINEWQKIMNKTGKRVQVFIGGALNETAAEAITRAQNMNDPGMITLGIGGVVDSGLVGTPNAPIALSTAQLAPRVAGIQAARGSAKPLTFARLAGCAFTVRSTTGAVVSASAPNETEIILAIENGVIPISRDSNLNSPLRLEKGVTTWQSSNTDKDRPYEIYKNPKFLKVMGDFEMNLTAFVEQEVITPGLPITQATREFVIGKAEEMLDRMVKAGLIQASPNIEFDPSITPTPQDNFLAIVYEWVFTRSVEQVRNTVVVS